MRFTSRFDSVNPNNRMHSVVERSRTGLKSCERTANEAADRGIKVNLVISLSMQLDMWLIYLLFIIFSFFAFTCDFTADVFLSNSCFKLLCPAFFIFRFIVHDQVRKNQRQKIKLWKHVIYTLQIPFRCAFHFSMNTQSINHLHL